MKMLIQSILFIIVVALFAVTSDRLSEIETKSSPTIPIMTTIQSGMSDQEFLALMIQHHEEAISMSQKILLPTDRQEIHDLANNIINTQTKEVELMQQWLKEWYGK